MADRSEVQSVGNVDDVVARLVALRRDFGLSQGDMAIRMNVTQPSVSAFENLDGNPTLRSLQRYARALGVRVVITLITGRRG